MKQLLSPLVWALVGAGALLTFWVPAPEAIYPRVVVPAPRIIEREPTVEIRFVDRIVYRTVEPEVVATAVTGGEVNVSEFCAAAVASALGTVVAPDRPLSEESPPAPPAPRALLLRSGTVDRGWFWRADRMTLTGPLSAGGLQQSDYRPRGDLQFVVSGDSVIVRSSRWWWVQEAIETAVWAGVGYGIGKAF